MEVCLSWGSLPRRTLLMKWGFCLVLLVTLTALECNAIERQCPENIMRKVGVDWSMCICLSIYTTQLNLLHITMPLNPRPRQTADKQSPRNAQAGRQTSTS